MHKKKVVILGGGFGGVYVGKYLLRAVKKGLIELTIVSKENHFLFTPLLHEVATGGLPAESIVEPLREIFRNSNVKILLTEAVKVDTARRVVETKSGTCPYDYLVLATGASSSPNPIWSQSEFVHSLKTIHDASVIRNGLIDQFELAVATPSKAERKKKLSFAVIGAGPTGTELVAEIADFARISLCAYFKDAGIRKEDISVSLIGQSVEIVPQFHPSARAYAANVLHKKGVKLLLGKMVSKITSNAIFFDDGKELGASLIVWAGGVSPVVPSFSDRLKADRDGRVSVDQYLRIEGFENIFSLGDVASSKDGKADGRPYPMLAQVAVRQAKIVARNVEALILEKRLRRFSFKIKGLLLSLGQWNAIAEVMGVRFYGKFAWWLWRTVYLFNFASWRKRFKVAVQWTINLVTPRDITRISARKNI